MDFGRLVGGVQGSVSAAAVGFQRAREELGRGWFSEGLPEVLVSKQHYHNCFGVTTWYIYCFITMENSPHLKSLYHFLRDGITGEEMEIRLLAKFR